MNGSHHVGQRWWVPWLYLVPGGAFLGVFFLWPAAVALQLSLYRYDVLNPAEFIGLANFSRLLSDPVVHNALRNTGLYLLGMIPFSVIFPILLASLVNSRLRFIHVFRALYFLPYITSMIAIAISWRLVFNTQGIINWLLTGIGVLDRPVPFLLSTTWALPAIILVEGWRNVGFFMLIYLAGIQAIPEEIFDAAKLDGAGPLQRTFRITLPLLMPYVAVGLTLGMLDAMRIFESIYVLTGGGPQQSTVNLGYLTWSTAFEHREFGYASAIGITMLVLMVLLSAINQRVARDRT